MLGGMLSTAQEAKKTEKVEFAEFQQWCENTNGASKTSIAAAASRIEQLSADVEKAGSDAEVLGEEAAQHTATSVHMRREVDNATQIRTKERIDYEAAHQEFSTAVDACNRAVQVMRARSADVPQSLMQVRDILASMPQEKSEIESVLIGLGQAPESNAYDFQSGSVVDMLEKLATKFKEERSALEQAEHNARHNHEVLMQRLTRGIKESDSDASTKTVAKTARLEDEAAAKGDLSLTEKANAEDEKALAGTTALCRSRSEDYESNQVTRAEEIKALEQAVEILTGASVQGHATTYLPTLLQRAKATARSLAQVRVARAARGDSGPARCEAYLQAQATKLGSHYLSVVAAHVSEDPFGRVKKLIEDLIVKLMEEANQEADHNAYCTSEVAMSTKTRTDLSSESEHLAAKVEHLTAEGGQTAVDLQRLSDEVVEIRTQQADATKLRSEEKANNNKTVVDSREAQAAVERAIKVLRQFYGKAASFLQRGAASQPAVASEAYTGLQADNGGVLGMLDVVLSDFSRLESETSTAEDQATSSYTTFMAESTEDVEVKSTEISHTEEKKRQLAEALGATQKQLGLTSEELDAALRYYDKLKADCLDTGLSYADRKRMREEEVASLQEALKMLEADA